MSRKYNLDDIVPSEVLAERLDELSEAVVARLKGDKGPMEREFTCRIPAELDRDADLVLSEAAKRIRLLEKTLEVERERLTISIEVLEEANKFKDAITKVTLAAKAELSKDGVKP